MRHSAPPMERMARLIALGAVLWVEFLWCSAIYLESPAREAPKYCTAFLHFPKSGGSSVKNQLIASSLTGGSLRPGLITGVRRTTPEGRQNIIRTSSVIMGYVEMLRLPLEEYGRNCEYFTMMRDPIDRLVSAFYFCPTDKVIKDYRPEKWCGNAQGQTAPLEDRLLEFATEQWGNSAFQLMMQSIFCDPRFELCHADLVLHPNDRPHNIHTIEGRNVMEDIKELLSTYTAVGILEEWDLSMQLFDAKVTSPVQHWNASMASNKAAHSGERQALLDWAYTSPQLQTALAADVALYEHAVAVFRQQTAETLNKNWD